MQITLKKRNDKYGFIVSNSHNRTLYSSFDHYFLTPSVQSEYVYAWEACRDAWKLVNKRPYHINGLKFARYDMDDPVLIDVSAEEMLITHYLAIYRDMRMRVKGTGKDKEEREKVYKEVKMVINELNTVMEKITNPKEKGKISKVLRYYQNLVNKYLLDEKKKDAEQISSTKIASCVEPEFDKDIIDDNLKRELLDEYAQRCCRAIQDKHRDLYYALDHDLNTITLMDFKNNPIIKININESMSVESIVPVDKLYKMYPFYSVDFYQKYWKPIVESLGHISVGFPPILLKIDYNTLPDVPKLNQSYTIGGWNCKEKQNQNIDIVFTGETPTWIFRSTGCVKMAQVQRPSEYTEQDYINAVVKCVDPNLKSIHGRTGTVIQVVPLEDMIEIDVDFGRGLDVVRLTEPQIQIVPIGE